MAMLTQPAPFCETIRLFLVSLKKREENGYACRFRLNRAAQRSLRRCASHGRNAVFESDIPYLKRVVHLVDRDHFDGVVLGQVVADPDANLASLATICCNVCRRAHRIVENGVRLRAELGAEATARRTAYFDIDIGNGIHR